MNIRLSAILVGALLLSVVLLLLPEPDRSEPQTATQAPGEAAPPQLTILDASVRSFGDDGVLNWSMRSPRIAYHLDGGLDFAAPIMLLQGTSNANLTAHAGQGSLHAADKKEMIRLYSQVEAKLTRGEKLRHEVNFDTEDLVISEQGQHVSAPNPVRISSFSIDTSAANLELNLHKQILLLGSAEQQPVSTRIQPIGLFE